MMERTRNWYRRIRTMKWLSPGSFVLCAVTFACVYLLLHLLGWRQSTGVFCGTLPAGRDAQVTQCFQAVMYVMVHMATVVVAPILVIAAATFRVMLLWRRRSAEFSATVQEPLPKDAGSAA